MSDSPLETAKTRFPISVLWQILGLPGRTGKFCRSPFRYEDDHNPSFSIYDNDRRWKDHATGEGGDAAAFLAKHLGVSNEDGCKKLIEMAGIFPPPKAQSKQTSNCHADAEEKALAKEKAQKRSQWPTFEIPTTAEIRTIVVARDLSEECVVIAVERGLLFCADSPEGRAWILSDSRRINAQARRMDGQPWERLNGKRPWSLPGSIASWPVGLLEAKDYRAIALVEGAPDLIAAFHLAWCSSATPETLALGKGVDLVANLGVVAILGAGNWIPANALPHFAGKIVRIFEDDDTKGRDAAARWATQLTLAGAKVDGFSFAGLRQSDGSPVNDLNDFVRLDPDQWESERKLLESAFDFVPAALTPN